MNEAILYSDGKILYDKVVIILNELDKAKEEIEAFNSNQNKLVHIGATLTIGEYLLPYLIGLTMADNQPFRINAHIANTAAVAKEVIDRTLPIGLIEGPIDPNDAIEKVEFWHDELVVVVSNQHPWANDIVVTFDELTAERYITREKGSGTREVAARALKRCGFDINLLNVAMELSSTKAIKQTVATGAGFSILSALTVQEECRNKKLSMLRVCDCNLSRPMSVITHKSATLSYAEQQFLDLLSKNDVLETIFPTPFLPSKEPPLTVETIAKNLQKPEADASNLTPIEDLIPQWDELSDVEQEICRLIREGGSANSAMLADAFHIAQRNVLPFINDLIAKGIVEAQGGSKKRHYRLVQSA